MRFFSATVIAALFAMADARSPRRCYNDECRDGRKAYATCRWSRNYGAASNIDVWPRGYMVAEQDDHTTPVSFFVEIDSLLRATPYTIDLVTTETNGEINKYTCETTGTPDVLVSALFTATTTAYR